MIAGLLAPSQGAILFDGKPLPPTLAGRTPDQFRRIQIVFQNADTALNPAHSVAQVLGRPLELYHGLRGAARERRIVELLDVIGLPAEVATRRTGELSGGQKQRINLARALAAEPDLILCDEVTSALDMVVGAAILDLLAELRRELSVSFMFISHDISTVRSICDDVVVLYAGRKVESGARQTFSAPPFHPYTHLLISSVPEMRRGWLEETAVRPGPAADRRRGPGREPMQLPRPLSGAASMACAMSRRPLACSWATVTRTSATTATTTCAGCRLRIRRRLPHRVASAAFHARRAMTHARTCRFLAKPGKRMLALEA